MQQLTCEAMAVNLKTNEVAKMVNISWGCEKIQRNHSLTKQSIIGLWKFQVVA